MRFGAVWTEKCDGKKTISFEKYNQSVNTLVTSVLLVVHFDAGVLGVFDIRSLKVEGFHDIPVVLLTVF